MKSPKSFWLIAFCSTEVPNSPLMRAVKDVLIEIIQEQDPDFSSRKSLVFGKYLKLINIKMDIIENARIQKKVSPTLSWREVDSGGLYEYKLSQNVVLCYQLEKELCPLQPSLWWGPHSSQGTDLRAVTWCLYPKDYFTPPHLILASEFYPLLGVLPPCFHPVSVCQTLLRFISISLFYHFRQKFPASGCGLFLLWFHASV